MIEINLWFIVLVIVNIQAFGYFYLLAHAFGGHRFDLRRVTVIKNILLFSGYGILIATLEQTIGDGSLLQLIINILPFIWMCFLAKRNLFENIIIFAMMFVTIVMIQPILLIGLHPFNLNQEALFLATQSLTVVVVGLIVWRVKLNRIFIFVLQRLYLKICLYLLVLIFLSAFAMLNFDANLVWQQTALFGTLIVTTLIGIVMTATTAQNQINEATNKYHDVVNLFNGLYLSIQNEEDISELKRQARELTTYITGREPVAIDGSDYKVGLEAMFQEKLIERGKNNDLQLKLGYHEHHKVVSFPKVMLMLGTLFDNALEHGLDQTISVYLNVSETIFELTVKNAIQDELSDRQLKRLFKKGYSTKESSGHGQGLYKLQQEVLIYNQLPITAQITADNYYDIEVDQITLEISINISTIPT